MNKRETEVSRHPIRVVSKRTGLTPAVLRAWEKRYGVVSPSRTEGGQRLYSDEDVERLTLLRRTVDEGRKISQVASLSVEELRGLVREDEAERRVAPSLDALGKSSASVLVEKAMVAVEEMDQRHLERLLNRGAMAHPVPVVLDQVVSPLLGAIGDRWEEGSLTPAQEHLAAGVVRRFLEWLLETIAVTREAPVVVTAIPAGERHEFGALLSAVSAAAEGWQAVFLGTDLPAEEIASASIRLEAEVVALSAVSIPTEEELYQEVADLRARLPADMELIVGGPMALGSRRIRELEGTTVLDSLESFRERLRELGARG